MTVIAETKDGRLIARAAVPAADILAAGPIPVSVAFPELKKVEYVLAVNLDTDPQTTYSATGTKVEKNVVGTTIYVGAGTTISGEVIAIGV